MSFYLKPSHGQLIIPCQVLPPNHTHTHTQNWAGFDLQGLSKRPQLAGTAVQHHGTRQGLIPPGGTPLQ